MARERRVNRNPLRRVAKSMLRGGASIVSNFKYHWWELELECGHTVERSIKYLPPADGSRPDRGWAAQHHPPSLDRIGDPPQRARCRECAVEQVVA